MLYPPVSDREVEDLNDPHGVSARFRTSLLRQTLRGTPNSIIRVQVQCEDLYN
jgi:hypothetical protein